MHYTEIDALIKTKGYAYIEIFGLLVKLDLTDLHERRYAACSILNVQYPQYDIDRMLISRFVQHGDKVLDAGANIGLTALLFLQSGAASVTAIEPLPELNQRIKNIQCDNIKIFKAALSSKAGVIDFYVSEAHNQGSTYDIETVNLFRQLFGDELKSITVPKLTIDGIAERFDIWKMNIEGAEIDALIGAQKTLANAPPRIIMAQLLGKKYEEFNQHIQQTHKYAYRAVITKDGYRLHLIPPDAFLSNEQAYHHTSPTFVFSQSILTEV